ncbi:MAG: glycosyltransferase [Desulfomonile tiedjei]|nr:glycosyltransferase [Desulfomonile tiedjei]
MNISLAIPVIERKWIKGLLTTVRSNSVHPQEVLVVDNGVSTGNGVQDICEGFSDLNVRYLPQQTNRGVNASWNLAMSEAQCHILSILNDDLILPNNFFSLVLKTFQTYPDAGFVVPNTVNYPQQVKSHNSDPVVVTQLVREGWAFTIRRAGVEAIPTSLQVFFGDDWVFEQIRKRKLSTLKITNCYVYHYVGISQNVQKRKDLGLPSLEEDRGAWNAIQAQHNKA